MNNRVAIILAAGVSSRMKTSVPKVLHEVCGRPMLAYVLDACRQVGVDKMYVIVGYGGDQVQKQFADSNDIVWIQQKEQLGTAHAVLCCKEHLTDFDGQTLVLCGDGPLIRAKALQSLIEKYESGDYATILATAQLDDPSGYGRIVRNTNGDIEAIVEHNDCTVQQLAIKEVNPSYYLFNNKVLFEALSEVKNDNAKGEYYITDTVEIILGKDLKAAAVIAVEPEEAMGANNRKQLSELGKVMQRRIQDKLMAEGVTIVSPANTWIDARAQIGCDTIIEPFSYIGGEVKIGKNCRIGPFAYVVEGMIIDDGTVVNPSSILSQDEYLKSSMEAES
jgi:bifunctional UDP-N-acetylglucosamine pyrophosphorylase/glucosamine-1-phosphate N-acetyltransferase